MCCPLAVDFASVADFDHPYCQFELLYGVDDAVVPLANAVSFLAREFFTTDRPWIAGKRSYSLNDPMQVIFRNGRQILPDGILEKDAISGHLLLAL